MVFYFFIKRLPILIDKKNTKINLQNQVLFISYLFNINKNDVDKPYGFDSFGNLSVKNLPRRKKS